MDARATLRPGQKGTKKLVARFGARLIFVRYRYDTERKKRFTTVELIVDETDWNPSIPISSSSSTSMAVPTETATAVETPAASPTTPGGGSDWNANEVVGLRVKFEEEGLREKVKAAGGAWNPSRRLWMLRRDRAIGLGLQDRIATPTEEKQVYAMRNLHLTRDTDG
jgi:hypothetical protein